MSKIENRDRIIENGQTPTVRRARFLVLQSLECAINAADPKLLVREKLSLEGVFLCVENFRFDLSKFRHIYIVGGGKAGTAMAQAAEEVLGGYVTAGLVNVPYGGRKEMRIVELNEASHPIPDQSGVRGVRRMVELAEKAEAEDLLICLISGGGSSLMPLPREGISLKDLQAVTDPLLRSGAPISEINVVRKHLSVFKGGWLAKKAYPAVVISLILSDVVGDKLDSIASGPTVPDISTFGDAINVLKKHNLWWEVPASICKVLSEGVEGKLEETPKPEDPAFANVCNVIIGGNRTATAAAAEYLKSEGLKTVHFDEPMEGEAKKIGCGLAGFADKVASYDFSLPKPLAAVLGGETTVTVIGKGLGGRNQELELAAALHLRGLENCVIGSLSTDGVDGPTDAAGAIVDGFSLNRAAKLGLDGQSFLAENDSYHFFERLGDLIRTGPTGTNVNDISVIVIL